MSTRSSIWLGEKDGKCVHVYWELSEGDYGDGQGARTPIYIAVDSGDADQEIRIRLPKDVAIRLLMGLSPSWADEVARII